MARVKTARKVIMELSITDLEQLSKQL